MLPCECSGLQSLDGHYKKGLQNPLSATALCVFTLCLPDPQGTGWQNGSGILGKIVHEKPAGVISEVLKFSWREG